MNEASANEHDTRIRQLEMEVAGLGTKLAVQATKLDARSRIEDLVKILLLFWAGITAVLGFFGLSQISGLSSKLDEMVATKYAEYLSVEDAKLKRARDVYDRVVDLDDKITEQNSTLLRRAEVLKKLEDAAKQFDASGALHRLQIETLKRESGDREGGIFEERWRAEAIATLEELARTAESMVSRIASGKQTEQPQDPGVLSTDLDPNDVFNAGQIAGKLAATALKLRLLAAAAKLSDSPSHRAAFLSTRIAFERDSDHNDDFQELLKLVQRLPRGDSHIIASEASNAAERLDRHDEFIAAIDELERSRAKSTSPSSAIPSYIFVQKAQSILRCSRPGSVERAKEALAQANEALLVESPLSPWYESTVREGFKVHVLVEAGTYLAIPTSENELVQALKRAGDATDHVHQDDEEDIERVLKLLGGVEPEAVESVETPVGSLRAGMAFKVKRPTDTDDGPGWIPSMDEPSRSWLEVERIIAVDKTRLVVAKGHRFKWSPSWVFEIRDQ